MNIVKPSIPKGTRDFTPAEMMRRNYIFDTIRSIFYKHAYLPIETPSMENLSTLMGKYGEEGDRLLFKILNSGDFTQGVDFQDSSMSVNKLATKLCEKGLRYDLTVPFARFVVQHQNDITFPFKRYQMQPVWRADRPQKGRYREFYQCDADIIGSTSLLNEAELVEITDEIFRKFGIAVTMKINNRKILSGIAEVIGAADKVTDLCTAMDKLDKIGQEAVCAEMAERGLCAEAIEKLRPVFCLGGLTNAEKIGHLQNLLANSEVGQKGLEELTTVLDYVAEMGITTDLEIDITLARGLNYYTGAIFEVKAKDVQMGSILGGGRYDNLTGIFGMPDVSGVGISFGADRIYDVLTELDRFPKDLAHSARVMFINFGSKEQAACIGIASRLRAEGIPTLIYPEAAKMKKQMEYANRRDVPFVAFVGESEMNDGTVTLKDMQGGTQETMSVDAMIERLR